MLFAWIIFSFYFLFALVNYRKSILAWMPMQLLFNNQIALRYDSPGIALVVGINFILILLYFIKSSELDCETTNNNKEKFVLKPFMYASVLAYGFSMIFSLLFSTKGISAMIKFFVCDLGVLFLFQKALISDKDIRYFIRCCVIVVLLTVSLGLFESIFEDNPWLDYVYVNSPHNEATHGRMFYVPPFIGDGVSMRYNMVRAYSFYGIHIAFGTCSLYFFFLLSAVFLNKWNRIMNMKVLLIFIALSAIGVFLANSKTAMVGMVIIVFALFKIKELLNFRILLLFIIVLSGVIIMFPEYLNNYISLVDSDVAEEGGGSTMMMRGQQFLVATDMWLQSPIFGNGPGSIEIMKKASFSYDDILGAESVWLRILPERGLFGAFVYLFMYLVLYKNFKKYIPRYQLGFYLFALLVLDTVSSTSNMCVAWGVLVALRRMYILYGNSEFNFSPQIIKT